MTFWIAFVLCITITTDFTSSSTIPETTFTNYKYYVTPITWNQAAHFCESNNGRLMNIISAIKQVALNTVFQHFRGKGKLTEELWTGLHSITANDNTSVFKWSTCANLSGTYLPWNIPFEGPGRNQCVAINTDDAKWYLRNCTELLPFICEYQTKCGCYMTNDTSAILCGNVSQSANVIKLVSRAEECTYECLVHVNGLRQCWGSTFDSSTGDCYLHEILRGTSYCPVQASFIFHRKACFSADAVAYTLTEEDSSSDSLPSSICSMESYQASSEECNFTKPDPETTTQSSDVTTLCNCPCARIPITNEYQTWANKTLDQQIMWLKSELAINKKNTFLAKRRKISASDDRVSARGIGLAGVFILVFVVTGIVCLDAGRLVHDIKNAARVMRKYIRYKLRQKSR